MSRLAIPIRDAVPEASRKLLAPDHSMLGFVPAFERLVGSSPAVAEGYAAMNANLSRVVDPQIRERVALAIAQFNASDYDLSWHSYNAINRAKISPDEITASRYGESKDLRMASAIRFALAVAHNRGAVSNEDLADVTNAGFSERELVELVALVTFNCFANYLNNVAATDIDFPLVTCAEPA